MQRFESTFIRNQVHGMDKSRERCFFEKFLYFSQSFTSDHKYLITFGYRYDRQVIFWNWKVSNYYSYGQPNSFLNFRLELKSFMENMANL